MAKIDLIYEAVDDFGLITSAEAADLGMSRAEMVQQEKLGKACQGGAWRISYAYLALSAASSLRHCREGCRRRRVSLRRIRRGAAGACPHRSYEDATGVPKTLPTRFGGQV